MSPSSPTERPQIPTTGMRGGLGRILLTAFLVLAIVPLSTISWYATQRERRDIQREVTAKLTSVAAMTETQARQWVEGRTADISLLANLPAIQRSMGALVNSTSDAKLARDTLYAQLRALAAQDSTIRSNGI